MATVNVMNSPYYIIHIQVTMKYIEELEEINSFMPRREKLRNIQDVSKRMTRFQIVISNNENVLQLQNKLQTIK